MTKYKITATVNKPGNSPIEWIRYSPEKLTRAQCEKMLSIKKEAGKSTEEKVTLENFSCAVIKATH
ncbi:DUF1187 family protein [Enterobacter ludwigii]|uniref:DUF1187 family protein n=1 Tax=Enterobacter ludwigii TaxID=299767 RepID=UPI003BEEB962